MKYSTEDMEVKGKKYPLKAMLLCIELVEY
jgi:hypothetical protein